MVFIKCSERRATLNGANMPSHHVLEVVHSAPPAQNSTERIYAAIERLVQEKNKNRDQDNGEDTTPQTH